MAGSTVKIAVVAPIPSAKVSSSFCGVGQLSFEAAGVRATLGRFSSDECCRLLRGRRSYGVGFLIAVEESCHRAGYQDYLEMSGPIWVAIFQLPVTSPRDPAHGGDLRFAFPLVRESYDRLNDGQPGPSVVRARPHHKYVQRLQDDCPAA